MSDQRFRKNNQFGPTHIETELLVELGCKLYMVGYRAFCQGYMLLCLPLVVYIEKKKIMKEHLQTAQLKVMKLKLNPPLYHMIM